MQIKLIPATPLPTVLFTVTYSEPPDYLGFPASWAQALHRLSADDLELPGTVHAFDKTTWLVAVLLQILVPHTTADVIPCHLPTNPEFPRFYESKSSRQTSCQETLISLLELRCSLVGSLR